VRENFIERANCRFNDFRTTDTRYDKLARNFPPACASIGVIGFTP